MHPPRQFSEPANFQSVVPPSSTRCLPPHSIARVRGVCPLSAASPLSTTTSRQRVLVGYEVRDSLPSHESSEPVHFQSL